MLAYASIPEFEIAAICTRSPESRAKLMSELPDGTPEANDYPQALQEHQPDAVCISTYPDTHYPFAKLALEAAAMSSLKNLWLKMPNNVRNWSNYPIPK